MHKKRLLFLTGRLAQPSLEKILAEIEPEDCQYLVVQLGLQVAALLTEKIILRRFAPPENVDQVVLPGRFRGNLDKLSEHFGIPFKRGPDELRDLPDFLSGKTRKAEDFDKHEIKIFAEICDAPLLTPGAILAKAWELHNEGADVIDLGFLPDTPFAHLGETIKLLKEHGLKTSVDTHEVKSLLSAADYGADYLLSITENTLWVADEVAATPVLIPADTTNLSAFTAAIDRLSQAGRDFIVDPVLDPIHCGFTASLVRYAKIRDLYPEISLMMGTGNLTELTHVDTAGVNTLLLGIASELRIGNILTTQVSEHCKKVVREADLARRILYVAHQQKTPPANIHDGLMMLHERKPFPMSAQEVAEIGSKIRDRSFRIQVSSEGVHFFNRNVYKVATDPFEFFPSLDSGKDTGHAFYLGVELARAQIAWQLGKRYTQDEELQWGCAVAQKAKDLSSFKKAGITMDKKK